MQMASAFTSSHNSVSDSSTHEQFHAECTEMNPYHPKRPKNVNQIFLRELTNARTSTAMTYNGIMLSVARLNAIIIYYQLILLNIKLLAESNRASVLFQIHSGVKYQVRKDACET